MNITPTVSNNISFAKMLSNAINYVGDNYQYTLVLVSIAGANDLEFTIAIETIKDPTSKMSAYAILGEVEIYEVEFLSEMPLSESCSYINREFLEDLDKLQSQYKAYLNNIETIN